MAVNFPENPQIGDTFLFSDITFRWDGEKWEAVGKANPLDASNINLGVLATEHGGTGLTTVGTDGQLLTANSSGGVEYKSIEDNPDYKKIEELAAAMAIALG